MAAALIVLSSSALRLSLATVLSVSQVGLDLPDHTVTPGFINPAVTQANIATTICVPKYTASIRPSASYTDKLKLKQLASDPYKSTLPPNKFEEDHFISLELGGHPTDERNLWPQHWSAPYGAHQKDQLENLLHRMVCGHKITLLQAQTEVSTDWIAAYNKYIVGK
jgi:hypothetical protein